MPLPSIWRRAKSFIYKPKLTSRSIIKEGNFGYFYLLDELLSNIPSNLRTNSILNKIHKIIERYIQLREEYSNKDQKSTKRERGRSN